MDSPVHKGTLLSSSLVAKEMPRKRSIDLGWVPAFSTRGDAMLRVLWRRRLKMSHKWEYTSLTDLPKIWQGSMKWTNRRNAPKALRLRRSLHSSVCLPGHHKVATRFGNTAAVGRYNRLSATYKTEGFVFVLFSANNRFCFPTKLSRISQAWSFCTSFKWLPSLHFLAFLWGAS